TGPETPRARCQRREARATTRAATAVAQACTAYCAGAGKTCLGRIVHADQSYHCSLRDPTQPNTAENAPPVAGFDLVPDVRPTRPAARPTAYRLRPSPAEGGRFQGRLPLPMQRSVTAERAGRRAPEGRLTPPPAASYRAGDCGIE